MVRILPGPSTAARRIRVAHLVDELGDAEAQRKTTRQSHADVVDRLIEMQKERVDILTKEYGEELAALRVEFESEFQRLVEEHRKEMKDAEQVAFHFDVRIDDSFQDMEAK